MRRILSFLCVLSVSCSSGSEAPPPKAAGTQTPQAKSQAAPVRRMVIRQASLQLRSGQPQRIAEQAGQVAAAVGGFVLQSESRSEYGRVRAEVQLRVPEPAFEATLRKLRGLGTLLHENVTGEDVSEEFVDVSARLRARRTLETRLLGLVEKSQLLTDLLVLEQELTRVRSEIERDEGRVRYLEERSSMAAIVLVAELPPEPFANLTRDAATRLMESAATAGELTLSVCQFAIAAFGFVLPLSPFLLAAWIVLRRRRIARAAVASAV